MTLAPAHARLNVPLVDAYCVQAGKHGLVARMEANVCNYSLLIVPKMQDFLLKNTTLAEDDPEGTVKS